MDFARNARRGAPIGPLHGRHCTTPIAGLHHLRRSGEDRLRKASEVGGSLCFSMVFHGFFSVFEVLRALFGPERPRKGSTHGPKPFRAAQVPEEPPCRDDLGWLEVRGGLRSHEVAHDRRLDAHVRQQVPRLERPVLGPKWLEKHGFSHFSALKISKNIKNTSEK